MMPSMDWGKYVVDNKPQSGTGYTTGLNWHAESKLVKRLMAAGDPSASHYLDLLTTWAKTNCGGPAGSTDGNMHFAACVDAYELSQDATLVPKVKAVRDWFNSYKTTKEGAFVQNNQAGQVWGDVTFMSLSFLTRYGTVLNDSTVPALAVKQITLDYGYLHDPMTGLLFHAYNENPGSASWDVVAGTNHNAVIWGRAMGWFLVSTVMILQEIGPNDPGYASVAMILHDLITALKPMQGADGRWDQVVDKSAMGDDWPETSCTAMYTYATYYAAQHGIVDSSFCDVANQGFKGVMGVVQMDPANIVPNVCPGTNAMTSYAQYIGRKAAEIQDDPHGLGTFLLMWEGLQE
jgi:unsaturated rhamnogalacturonyl hydrolase